jgi:hypothetical protein
MVEDFYASRQGGRLKDASSAFITTTFFFVLVLANSTDQPVADLAMTNHVGVPAQGIMLRGA